MSVDCSDTIDTLGKLLFELHRGINTVQAPGFKEWALQQIKPLLHFDKAIWAMGTSEDKVLHNVHMHGLPSEFMKNYEKFKSQDRLLSAILAQPGKALRTLDIYSQSEREELEIVRNHAKSFEIEDATVIAIKEPITGLMSFFSLYRCTPGHLFGERDRTILQTLAPHLVECANLNRLHFVGHAVNQNAYHTTAALCDQQGCLHQVDNDFPKLLQTEWPEWKGAYLPSKLLQAFEEGKLCYAGKQVLINITRLDDVYLLQASEVRGIDQLSARELEVALLLSKGLSYKTIGDLIEISHSTVNKHALSIYKKLGISNKTELSGLIMPGLQVSQ